MCRDHTHDTGEDALRGSLELGSVPIAELLDRQVAGYGDRPFLTFYDDSRGERVELSYKNFDNWVHKTANLLVDELGVEQGDRVATVTGPHWQASAIQFACWRVGACAVPIDLGLPPEAMAAILEATGCAVAFVREEWLAGLREAAGDRLSATIALCADMFGKPATDLGDTPNFSRIVLAMPDIHDGETGSLYDDALVVLATGDAPAGVVESQTGLLTRAAAITERWALGPGDRVMGTLADHDLDGVVTTLLVPFAAGAGTVLNRAFNPGAWWRRSADERVTVADITSVETAALLAEEATAGGPASAADGIPVSGPGRLRLVAFEGGPPAEALAERWRERFGLPLRHWAPRPAPEPSGDPEGGPEVGPEGDPGR
jgi:uncharacterized protein (TIGR03089 family)